MKQVPCRGPTNIRRYGTKLGRHGELAPGICEKLRELRIAINEIDQDW